MDLNRLPRWVQTYMTWHGEVRRKFPDDELLTNPNAPGLLVRTCTIKCGGLHDRLGKLPWDLLMANQTRRILMLSWCIPAPLETFLQPVQNGMPGIINWTLPTVLYKKLHHSNDGTTCPRAVPREMKSFFAGERDKRGTSQFWKHDFDQSIRKAQQEGGPTNQEKILRHSILGDDRRLRLQLSKKSYNEDDYLDWTPSFATIFWLFFQPTKALREQLDQVQRRLNLVPGDFSAVHARVRHPKALSTGGNNGHTKKKELRAKADLPGGPDRHNLDWTHEETRDYAIETAVHAVKCAHRLQPQSQTPMTQRTMEAEEPLYFYSDSEDLVRYMTQELYNSTFVQGNSSLFDATSSTSSNSSGVFNPHAAALAVTQRLPLVGREMLLENLHIDRQGGREPFEYFGSFIDLFIAAQARCITVGVGNYAVFAAKISIISSGSSRCLQKYKEETWGRLR